MSMFATASITNDLIFAMTLRQQEQPRYRIESKRKSRKVNAIVREKTRREPAVWATSLKKLKPSGMSEQGEKDNVRENPNVTQDNTNLEDLSRTLINLFPKLPEREQKIAVQIYRLLA